MTPRPAEIGSRAVSRLRGALGRDEAGPELHAIKTRAIDHAFELVGPQSFADLGGIWAIDGGYTFYALEQGEIERAYLVDEDVTEATAVRARSFPQLELVQGNFGDPAMPDRIGDVDVIVLFDVLLHQVNPDWDGILEMYAPKTEAFVILNPQWVGSPETVRLIDLGRERYLSVVPPQDNHDMLFDRLDEMHPRRNRLHRDVHEVWQWGIVDDDLTAKMDDLGFDLVYYENGGPWDNLKTAPPLQSFENRAFVFRRR